MLFASARPGGNLYLFLAKASAGVVVSSRTVCWYRILSVPRKAQTRDGPSVGCQPPGGPSASRAAARSPGSGSSKARGRPSTGWVKPRA